MEKVIYIKCKEIEDAGGYLDVYEMARKTKENAEVEAVIILLK